VVRDVLPLAVALNLVYSVPLWLVSLLYLGYLSFYECGYLWNDRAESASERGGDRLSDKILNLGMFFLIRAVVVSLVSVAIYHVRGAGSAIRFDVVNALLVVLMVLHTSRGVRNVRFLRVTSFAALAFYRYLPVLLPLLPWATARGLLVAVFLSWGLLRVLVYTLRKHGDSDARVNFEFSNRLLQAVLIVVFAPVFLTTADIRNWRSSGPLVVWATFAVGQGVLFVLHFARRALTQGVVRQISR